MWQETDGDRRKECRHRIWIDIKIISPKNSFWGVATNISGGGLEIQSPTIINPKTKLMICMKLQEEFVFHGIVIWTLGDFTDGQWVYRVGMKTDAIAFKNMTAKTTEKKAELVQKILPQIRAKGAAEAFAV